MGLCPSNEDRKHKWAHDARPYWNGRHHWDQHGNSISLMNRSGRVKTQKHHLLCSECTFGLVRRIKKAFFTASACQWQQRRVENERKSCNRTETCTDWIPSSLIVQQGMNIKLNLNREIGSSLVHHVWEVKPKKHSVKMKIRLKCGFPGSAVSEAAACHTSRGTVWAGGTGASRGGQTSWERDREGLRSDGDGETLLWLMVA